ncbi:hypothetical protein CGCS363_v010983 [Colletotrichum siamense]|uniref:uncharacterized protein n=1 Tax=Colletotrichum siamense TaxID=690259 RepID=UPI001872E0FA|nr:uncharacterized protein CGCS363_v010983 [Colletotrichum siamense]KAF5491598.1 hypothetical protein CGCS363_v010983 [Colletotrichum siamense]
MLYGHVFMEESFPTVDVVHRLLVRKQTRRILSVKLWVLSAQCNSSELKKLVAFGEIKPSLAPGPYEALSEDLIFKELKSEKLIHRLATSTCKLEQLCLSYVVDASKSLIIAEGQPALHWLKLETLALTSPSFHIGNEAGIIQMLETAAKIARKMPELRTLELWNAEKSHAFAFTCRITPSAVEILYRATWEFKLAGSVEKLWEDLAQERNQGHKVCVQRGQLINASEWKSHGDAIHALNLTADVVHPVSLMQIRRGEIISPAEMPPMEQQ